ncbi:uncharacterized protein LOC106876717 [Octopus bimaculoides]|uniref:FHA domain-containing protein n=1 Tax=Octopus bimaculoides TaxID=37653 RepID=A0A0L8GIB1_OCTBM|nr:uncharacterized protein LOC106876717 [Octopus bimaculoides]|eukprot:XP_014780874.1 PREDICTED: uncharacterized protein LOC106876717 [Octopus bimaculoides]
MLEEGSNLILRHVGPKRIDASTCPPLMTLKKGKTTFGRHPRNDYLIDSSTFKNFISRWHCKIEPCQLADGKIVYKIFDCSLNGTFVNDYRVSQDGCVLNNGDKIIFGHLNGSNITAGSFARQPKSIFQYVFQDNNDSLPNSPKNKDYKNIWSSPCCRKVIKLDQANLSLEYFGDSDVFDSSDIACDDDEETGYSTDL